MADTNVINKLTQQILSSSDTSRWTGEGYGSAQANAADMAKILSQAGITDVKQLGVKQEFIPASYGEFGEIPAQTVSKYYNKDTGQELGNTYGERQTGNFFGGTFAGKGNTGYGVQFDAQGNPQFYTQGASSSDVKDLMPIISVALNVALPGIGAAIGETLEAAGLVSASSANVVGTALAKVSVNVAMGQDLTTAVKDAAISSVVQTGSISAAKEIVTAGLDPKLANAISSVGGSIVSTAARGGNASDILTNAVAAGGASALISMDVSPTLAKAIGVAASGGSTQAVLNTLASGFGGEKDIKNVVAGALLPSETDTTTTTAGARDVTTPTKDDGVVITAPAGTSADQPIIDLISGKTPTTPVTQAGEVKVTDTKAQTPTIVDTTAAPVTTPTTPVTSAGEVTVTAPRDEKAIIDTIPEVKVTDTRTPTVDVTATKETTPIVDTIPEVKITDTKTPNVDVTATKETTPIIDTVPEIKITDTKIPETVITAPKDPTVIDTTTTSTEDVTKTPTDETPPYKPDVVIFGGVPPKTKTLSKSITAPYFGKSGLEQALTAYRPAGEIEDESTGKPRKNVWNEASLRLKDALGL